MGNAAAIKNKLSALRKLQNKHPLLFAHIADCHLKLGKFGAAQRVLKKGIAKYPHYPAGWVVEGQYFFLHNQLQKARDSFKRVIELDPFNGYAHEHCSEIAADFNDHEDYIFHIKAMSRLNPLDENIQKMRQAEELRQIAINNGLYTSEEAEQLHSGALRQALLERNLLPVELSRTLDRELAEVHFDEFNIGDDSDDDDHQAVVEIDSEAELESQVHIESQSEEAFDADDLNADLDLMEEDTEPTEQLEELEEVISEEEEEEGTADWFDDPTGESEAPPLESVQDTQTESTTESDLTDWAPEEIPEDSEESDTGVEWSRKFSEEESAEETGFPESDVELELDTFDEEDSVYEDDSEDDMNLELEDDISSTVATISEEDDVPEVSPAKPKTFAEFQALQQAEEIEEETVEETIDDIVEETDQPAKPVFDIKSLGITEDFKDDIDDIFADEDVVEPPAEDSLAVPSEEDEAVDPTSMAVENITVESTELLDTEDSIEPYESETSETASEEFPQELSQEPESQDIEAEIRVISGLEGASAIVEADDYDEELTEVSLIEPDVAEIPEPHIEAEIDSEPDLTESNSRQQPQIESAMSQVIGSDEPIENIADEVESVTEPEVEPVVEPEPDPIQEPEPEPEPEPKPEPVVSQEMDKIESEHEISESDSMLPPLTEKTSSADDEIKTQLKEIAAEVTGVEPISPVQSEPVAPQAPPAPEPDPQKPKRIATKTLAELYASQGDWHRAINVYEELLGRHPDNDAYKQRLNDLRSKLN